MMNEVKQINGYPIKDEKARAGFLTPEMFGAKGTGKPGDDDTDSVQACINEAILSDKKVKLVSQYYITQPLVINKSISIEGEGVINVKKKLGCGFIHEGTALRVISESLSSVGTKLKNIYFKQVENNIPNIHAVVITGEGAGYYTSGLSVVDCDFENVTGYAVKFEDPSYSQMVEIKNLSCWKCGGIIGAATEDAAHGNPIGLFVTCATLDNINLDDGVNQVSPQSPILDLSGFREYTLNNVVIEGAHGNRYNGRDDYGVGVRISNSRHQSVNGVHLELQNNRPVKTFEVVESLYSSKNDNSVYSKSSYVNLNSITLPLYVTARSTEVNLNGVYTSSSEQCIFIEGEYSTVRVENIICGAPNYNIFNFDSLSSINYRNLAFSGKGATDSLPVSLKSSVPIFDWNAAKGALWERQLKPGGTSFVTTGYGNDYFQFDFRAQSGIPDETSDVLDVDGLGYVQRFVPTSAQGNTLSSANILIKPEAKPFLIGKRITASITYRITSEKTTGKVQAISFGTSHSGCALINESVINELAVGACSLIVNEQTSGFNLGLSNGLEAPAVFDIIGIKISIGSEVEATPPVFSLPVT